jgi:hypothetical protein
VVVGFDIEDVPTIVAARDLDESSIRQSRRPSLAAEESEIDRDYVHQGSAVVRQGESVRQLQFCKIDWENSPQAPWIINFWKFLSHSSSSLLLRRVSLPTLKKSN